MDAELPVRGGYPRHGLFAPDVLSALPLFYLPSSSGRQIRQPTPQCMVLFSAPDAGHPYCHPASSTGLESDASCDRLQQFFRYNPPDYAHPAQTSVYNDAPSR